VVFLEGDNLIDYTISVDLKVGIIITGVPLVGVTLYKGDYFDDKWKNLGP
jgi:hypothetical protein